MINYVLKIGAILTLSAATVQLSTAAVSIPVPDAGSTALLLGLSAAGLTVARRFFAKK